MQLKRQPKRTKNFTKECLVKRFCTICSLEIIKNPRTSWKQYLNQKYCTLNCKGTAYEQELLGENNPNYKHGLSTDDQIVRGSNEYKTWRKLVFKRDKYTCQVCKKVGGNLNADHIKPFALYPKLRFNLSNGRTLCVPCHKNTPTYGVKVK